MPHEEPLNQCIADRKRIEGKIDKHTDESVSHRERLLVVEGKTGFLEKQVHDHKWNSITGTEVRLRQVEQAVIDIKRLGEAVAEWMVSVKQREEKEASETKKEVRWWQHEVFKTLLQVATIILLFWLGIKH